MLKKMLSVFFSICLLTIFYSAKSMNLVAQRGVCNERDIDLDPNEESVEQEVFEAQKECEYKFKWLVGHGCTEDVASCVMTDNNQLGQLVMNHEMDSAMDICEKAVNYANSGHGPLMNSPFYDAICENNLKIVELLLPYTTKKTTNIADKDGWSPITWACFNGNLELVKLLFPASTRETINKVTAEGFTPLSHAMTSCCLEMVKLLLENVAHFDKKSKSILCAYKKSPDGQKGRREIVEYFESKACETDRLTKVIQKLVEGYSEEEKFAVYNRLLEIAKKEFRKIKEK